MPNPSPASQCIDQDRVRRELLAVARASTFATTMALQAHFELQVGSRNDVNRAIRNACSELRAALLIAESVLAEYSEPTPEGSPTAAPAAGPTWLDTQERHP